MIGVFLIPGLYYIFGKIADKRYLLKDESDEPLSETPEHPVTAHGHERGMDHDEHPSMESE